MLQLKDKNDMPCGLDVGYEICKTQQSIFILAMDMGFDDDDFVEQYMCSDFCNREMDALYSYHQIGFPDYTMSVLLDEIHPKKNNLHYNHKIMKWIGWMYRYMQLRLEIPSKVIYDKIPLKTMLRYYTSMRTEDAEYFIERIQTKFER